MTGLGRWPVVEIWQDPHAAMNQSVGILADQFLRDLAQFLCTQKAISVKRNERIKERYSRFRYIPHRLSIL
jgi:hypothetical protein